MGDRSNVFIQQHRKQDGEWSGIGIYSHWSGVRLHDVAIEAIKKAESRINDPSYFARIIVHNVLDAIADVDSPLGFGLWTDRACDNEHPVLVINSQTGKYWYASEGDHASHR